MHHQLLELHLSSFCIQVPVANMHTAFVSGWITLLCWQDREGDVGSDGQQL